MDSARSCPRVTAGKKHAIEVPSCVHAVKPLDDKSACEHSRLQNIIAAYDHLIDTAAAQLQLLENSATATATVTATPTPTQAAGPKAEVKADRNVSARACAGQLDPRFSYKWPADLKYPFSVAVKIHPEHVPATPWLFRRIFGSTKVHVRLLRHSTFRGVLPSLVNDNAQEYKLGEVKVVFTVIVHGGVERLEFVDDPIRQGRLYDEHNLQRYLLRLLEIFSPVTDPVQDAMSESYVDTVGAGLLQQSKAAAVKKSLAALDGELRSRTLLVRPNQPTAADFSLFAASYEHDVKGFAAVEAFRKQLEGYFGFENDDRQWFKTKV